MFIPDNERFLFKDSSMLFFFIQEKVNCREDDVICVFLKFIIPLVKCDKCKDAPFVSYKRNYETAIPCIYESLTLYKLKSSVEYVLCTIDAVLCTQIGIRTFYSWSNGNIFDICNFVSSSSTTNSLHQLKFT